MQSLCEFSSHLGGVYSPSVNSLAIWEGCAVAPGFLRAAMEAHIDDVSLGTNTQEDHILFLQKFFTICQENHLHIKLEKCEFMREEMEYLGFDVGYGWWKPAISKMPPLQDMQIHDDPKKRLQDVHSFVGTCNCDRHHIHDFTYSSAPLTVVIKKTNPCRPTDTEEACLQELKKKNTSTNCLGVPCLKSEIILLTDACDVGGGGYPISVAGT